MSIRRTVLYSGTVQGVGFRFTTCRVAANHAVTGTVRNLPDGRVELVAEGAPEELDRFCEGIRQAMPHYITDASSEDSPATDSFDGFRIAY